MDITKAYPSPVNIEALMETVRATYSQASQGENGFRVHNIAPENEVTVSADLDSMIANHDHTVLTAEQQIEAAQSGLLDKVALAEQYAVSIKTLYNAVLDQTENQTGQPNRFNALYAVVLDAPLAFRTRFVTDCTHELGFDVAGTLTANQQRQATLYTRVWVTGLALLLMARKVL